MSSIFVELSLHDHPVAFLDTSATLLQDLKQVPLTGIGLLSYAQQDPTWDQIPKEGSKRGLDTPENREYQVKLMKETAEIKQIYSAFYRRRLKEDHKMPFWWLDFEDDVSLPPPSFSITPAIYKSLLLSTCSFVMIQETCKLEHFLQEIYVCRQHAHEERPLISKTPSGRPCGMISLEDTLIVTEQPVLDKANEFLQLCFLCRIV